MNFLKIFNFLVSLLFLNSFFCENILKPIEVSQEALQISRVFHDVVDEFLIKQELAFDILIFEQNKFTNFGILSAFLSENSGNFSFKLISDYIYKTNYLLYMSRSTLIFTSSIDAFFEVLKLQPKLTQFSSKIYLVWKI